MELTLKFFHVIIIPVDGVNPRDEKPKIKIYFEDRKINTYPKEVRVKETKTFDGESVGAVH